MKTNANRYRRGRRRRIVTAQQALATLDEISTSVLTKELPEVLDLILEAASSCTGAEEGAVFLLDYVRDELLVSSYTGIEDQGFRHTRIQVGDKTEPINLALENRGPVVQRGVRYAKERAVSSLISIPILSGKSSLGVLCACRRREGSFPTRIEQKFLVNLANLAALAIENHRQNEEARRNAEALAAAADWGKDPDPLLQKVVESALVVSDAQVVILYEYDEETGDVRMPPKIAGDPWQREVLAERGGNSRHRNSVVFQMLARKKSFWATNAVKDWLEEGFYGSEEEIARSFLLREGIESSSAVPLWVQDRPIGVLFINYRWPQLFTPGLQRRIELFAGQAAIAIHHSRRSERYFRNLELLQNVCNTINAFTARDLAELCGLVHQQVIRLMEARNFIFCLYDERTQTCTACYMEDEKDKLENFDAADWNSGRCAEVCRTGVPLLRNQDAPPPAADRVVGTPSVSWLGAPMKAGGRVIGAMAVQSYAPGFAYSKEHKALLATLAAQTGNAVDQFLSLSEAHREAEELRALCESAEVAALEQLEPHEALQTILRQAIHALRAEGGVVFRFNAADRHLYPECIAGIPWPSSRSLHWGEGLTGMAVRQRATLVREDYLESPSHLPELEEEPFRDKVVSVIAAALLCQGQELGALTLGAGKERPFTSRDKEMVNRFARLAEVVLRRRALEGELRELSPEEAQ